MKELELPFSLLNFCKKKIRGKGNHIRTHRFSETTHVVKAVNLPMKRTQLDLHVEKGGMPRKGLPITEVRPERYRDSWRGRVKQVEEVVERMISGNQLQKIRVLQQHM